MGYYIEQGEKLEDAMQRIAIEQIDKAIDEINDAALERSEIVHQVRKRCKKIRGLLRLVRPGIDFYSAENKAFRNAARRLSQARDLQAMTETYDLVMDEYEPRVKRQDFGGIRRTLTLRKQEIVSSDAMGERLCKFHAEMVDARQRVADWKLEKSAGKALSKGVRKTYGRAVDAMAQAYDTRSSADFHEWRKRAKYHWYHARLMKELWPEVIKPYRNEVKRVSSALGDHHDLAVLADKLRSDRQLFGDADEVAELADMADELRCRIGDTIAERGRLVFSSKPKQLGKAARRMLLVGGAQAVTIG